MSTARRDGLLLAASAVIGMALVNSPLAPGFQQAVESTLRLGIGAFALDKTVHHWINDALMALFFLVVGIEIKHEWQRGALATPQARRLPFGAAAGGMLAPALIYLAFNGGEPQQAAGWAIPSATDIAFALGLMALLAPRTPPALLAFLTAVAVLDDLGAIIIIALFYTAQLSHPMLAGAAASAAVLFALSGLKVQRAGPYLLLGAVLWLFVLKSGVHATLAGVITGLFMPLGAGERTAQALKPWVGWLILPLFGVVNAGVPLQGLSAALLLQPVTLGIALGLLAGKPVGILLGVWAAGRGALLPGTAWRDYVPVACFCGVGFTMALFIGTLAFEPPSPLADAAKLGVLLGTTASLVLGALLARWLAPRA